MRCIIALLALSTLAFASEGWGDHCYGRNGDGQCDIECFSMENSFDNGDCSGLCNPGCYNSSIGNGDCDSWCMTEECNYDGGDCGDGGACGDWNCAAADWGNGMCDWECANADCAWDGGDCLFIGCAPNCYPWLIGNEQCDIDCWTEECFWDGYDCEGLCAPSCYIPTDVGNGYCDMDCYNEACNWDGGDCDAVIGQYCDYPYCQRSQVGDGNCDTTCYNDYCNRDGGDCDAYGYCGEMDGYTDRDDWWCHEDMIGNNHCDDRCNNEDCGYDGGDCDFSLVYYSAEFVDTTCTGEALEVFAKYCTNENDWVCNCPSEPACYPDAGNLLEGCATVAEFDALIDRWFKEEPAWDATFANTDCHGRPSMIYYWTKSDCILIDNNLWGYTEWSPEGVHVPHICTDPNCDDCFVEPAGENVNWYYYDCHAIGHDSEQVYPGHPNHHHSSSSSSTSSA